MNPVIAIVVVALIWAMLFIAPNVVMVSGGGVIALICLAIPALVIIFWWKVIVRWFKQL